jgi:hypothetical protein
MNNAIAVISLALGIAANTVIFSRISTTWCYFVVAAAAN